MHESFDDYFYRIAREAQRVYGPVVADMKLIRTMLEDMHARLVALEAAGKATDEQAAEMLRRR